MLKDGAATVTEGVGVTVTVPDVPPPETATGIVTGVPLAAVTSPVTVIGGKLCPAAKESLRVQVGAAGVHAPHPDPEMEVMVKPVGGSATVTVPLVAAFPVLETVMV